MNVRAEILKEHSKVQALKIARYACSSPYNFDELMKCFMADDYQVSQRAAWSLDWAARNEPSMILPYIGDLVTQIQNDKVHPSVIRHSLRILEDVDIPEVFHGDVMNACFNFLESASTPAAIKVFSLTTLRNLAGYYPEIKKELKLIIEERWPHESKAFKSRGRTILASL